MSERLVITSTYYPPTGEDTRKVSCDATSNTFDHMMKRWYRAPGKFFIVTVIREGQKKPSIKLGNLNRETV